MSKHISLEGSHDTKYLNFPLYSYLDESEISTGPFILWKGLFLNE